MLFIIILYGLSCPELCSMPVASTVGLQFGVQKEKCLFHTAQAHSSLHCHQDNTVYMVCIWWSELLTLGSFFNFIRNLFFLKLSFRILDQLNVLIFELPCNVKWLTFITLPTNASVTNTRVCNGYTHYANIQSRNCTVRGRRSITIWTLILQTKHRHS